MTATAIKTISEIELGKTKARQVRIRRKQGAGGFFHQGKVVAEGEEITCDFDIARTLVANNKAEYVT